MDKIIKIVLAILFFLCLLDMPYGYFQFVRFAGMIGFVYLAYQANAKKQTQLAFVSICLAILFQPIFKISLGRTLWNIVDVIVGLFLMFNVFYRKK